MIPHSKSDRLREDRTIRLKLRLVLGTEKAIALSTLEPLAAHTTVSRQQPPLWLRPKIVIKCRKLKKSIKGTALIFGDH